MAETLTIAPPLRVAGSRPGSGVGLESFICYSEGAQPMNVEVVTASCCTPAEIQRKIESVLQGLKKEIPELTWSVVDIAENLELSVKYGVPITPSIFIDGKLEFAGYPKQSSLEAKIRGRSQNK